MDDGFYVTEVIIDTTVRPGMRHLLLLPCLLLAPDPRSELTTYVPMDISAPSGDKAANIKVHSVTMSHHSHNIFIS